MNSRSEVLEKIAYADEVNPRKALKSQYIDIMIQGEDLYLEYKKRQEANKAIVIESQVSELQNSVEEILQKVQPNRLLYASSLSHIKAEQLNVESVCYNQQREEMGEVIFQSDCSLLEANLGISNLGIINVVSSVNAPRLLSLATNTAIFLLSKERIVRNIPEALRKVKLEAGEILPTNILFIGGPSRTADIEFQVVLGVHGPREVFVVLY
ncbi:hypothetical protein CCZ01_00770 [Helicobacter monodelphidis]|uniref:LutC/YkgG family protein n=1 Tax=Helicobacter sp. 15-1451 TaxID=2004995 RepID=UPI000DCDF43B|nr:lactate utilization protein C [Helicobacter sp. 15-1451]RAX59302.1 hypothetical protein CCZ01_00770 [Helicobacter sp. 15-1451]